MLSLRTLREYFSADIADEIREVIDRVVADEDYPLDAPLENLLGGDIFVAQTEEDLKQIPAWDLDGTGGETIATHIGLWEIAEKLSERWAFLWLGTNNSGGPAYFIPSELWESCRIDKQLENV